ncbi:MAG: NAD(P)-dependent oxidoreductase [Chloroflexi bacterium]|nr:NAD(P)-dependent oxidoreductase [Chloroflexota bacterium]
MTGATGVLGQPTVRLLIARGHHVTALARNEERAQLVRELGATPRVGDLFDAQFVRDAINGADCVMHLATAIPKKVSPAASDWAMNDRLRAEGTRNLLHAVQKRSLHSFVVQSVAFLYGDTHGEWKREDDPLPRKLPRNLKSAAEMEQHALVEYKVNETPVVILRGALFYGPTTHSTRAMLDAIRHRHLPIIGSGNQYWHWVYVDDMARACVIAAEHPAPGEIFNVADDWAFHARDGLNYIAAQLNAPAPFRMSFLLARILGGSAATFFAQSARYRTDKIKKMLGWAPKYPTYREGMAEILRMVGKR